MKKILAVSFLLLSLTFSLHAEIIQQIEKGYLELNNGQQILHLKGNPYEIGYQHGRLLKAQIAHNISRFIDGRLAVPNFQPLIQGFLSIIPQIITHIPDELIQEMQGLADGAEQPYNTILLLNLFPEMFHCSAITASGKATQDEALYHVRVLDYAAGISLQDTALLAVVEPQQGFCFINVTYAGFIGTVTGMNGRKIAIGEIGGKGYGSWNGLPMAFLLRQILQYASSIDEIKQILANAPRTCEYYYIFSDGKNRNALAAYATPQQLIFIDPGTSYTIPLSQDLPPIRQPEDCLILANSNQHPTLLDRLMANYSHLTPNDFIEAIKQPVAHTDNLHNAIFAPETLEIWVAHAGPNNEPACDQPYYHFEWKDLFPK